MEITMTQESIKILGLTHKLVQPFGTMYFKKEGSAWFWWNKEAKQFHQTKLLDKPKILAQLVSV